MEAIIGPLIIMVGLLVTGIGWIKEKIYPTDWEKIDPHQLHSHRDPSGIGCIGFLFIIIGFIVMFAFLQYQSQ